MRACDLLGDPALTAADGGRHDLADGLVDPVLVAVLAAALEDFALDVRMIRTGHPMGPATPAGRRNAHAWGCAADVVYAVDGAEVATRPVPVPVVRFGSWLWRHRGQLRVVMGPAAWHGHVVDAVGPPFRDDAVANQRHADHVHVEVAIPDGAGVPTA